MSTLESDTTDDYVGYVDGKTNDFKNFKAYARPLTFQAQVISSSINCQNYLYDFPNLE